LRNNSSSAETAVIEIPQGRLLGLRRAGIRVFCGIPYAKPPHGMLRWQMPEPADCWAGLRDATRFAPVCPQAPTPFDSLLGGALGRQSEDCLSLNVWTPDGGSGSRPVMVWIHGGAFVIGAGSQAIYDGFHLAAHGVVVVTINYRLGVFGFLNLADATDGRVPGTGAEGLADQLLAIAWVRDNIAAFGGDPRNVTVFGESAGAMSIAALLASPRGRGLFDKAVAQSGSAHIGLVREHSARIARAVLGALEISQNDAARASEVPAAELVKAQIAVLASAHDGKDVQKFGRLPFQPTIDGHVLCSRAIDAIRKGSSRDVALLAGTTREEWKLFTAADPRVRLMSMARFETRLARAAGDATPLFLKAYSAGSPFERFNAFMTDRIFAVPTARLLQAQQNFAPAFAYRFDWRSPLTGGIFGSCHALELGFVFGTHNKGPASIFFGAGRAADTLAQAMMECWTAFAHAGDPSTAATGTWPRFERTGGATMIFGDGAPHFVRSPEVERMAAWDFIPDQKVGP
jgi:para-nitrobenzyl esterase